MVSVALLTAVIPDQPQADARAAAARTVAYLRTEVPRWRREHPCYSCHNNGDATRALLAASARGHAVADAIDDTVAWLATPERWDTNARRGGSEEQPLARIQFASALASMVAAGRAEADALDRAAGLLVAHQQEDGSWRLSDTQILGGATFYGTSLATAMARRILVRARTASVQSPLAKASGWLRTGQSGHGPRRVGGPPRSRARQRSRSRRPTTTVARHPPARPRPRRWLGALCDVAVGGVRHRAGAAGVGGTATRRCAFDRALFHSRSRCGYRTRTGVAAPYAEPGRQLAETTRPPNGDSYAQRISTTAWALMALLETN